MNDLLRPARMELNLLNLAHNFREVKKLVRQRPVICSVKADAYGHGALSVSRVLEREGAAALGVATVKEAAVLREGGITAPIVCFSLIPDNLAAYVFEYDIVPVISGIKSAKALAATGMGKYGKEAKVMVAVDTGMGRVGFLPDEKALEDIRQISKIEGITITGIFPTIELGDRFELEGEKVFHPSYGPQFRVTSYVTKEPATKEAILAFLSSGVLDGIGRTMAERIFDKFGLDAIRVWMILRKNFWRLKESERKNVKRLLKVTRTNGI